MTTNTSTEIDLTDIQALTPGTWNIEPAHSSVEVVARHMMVTKVRGRFTEFTGAVHVAEDRSGSWAEAAIKTTSIDTNQPQRDAHLTSPDFLDSEQFPEITFKSTKLEGSGSKYKATGDLTVKGQTRPVVLDVEFGGVATSPFGHQVAFLSASTEIDREDFGMTWNQALETGGVLVSKKMKIEIEAQLVQAES